MASPGTLPSPTATCRRDSRAPSKSHGVSSEPSISQPPFRSHVRSQSYYCCGLGAGCIEDLDKVFKSCYRMTCIGESLVTSGSCKVGHFHFQFLFVPLKKFGPASNAMLSV
ncbi:hypothetical protein M6B38_336175 [Iris pallida]|uniref:Uncharacterized protein n=1 Tax=Iris pallida TaxID=29817 RepID=A0AAX6EJD4_IRIPA|nr:hypothetical protein M6B38_186340 [Iris pallida]KAJ6834204.1 hypothetical protein M6B38_336175 [Iris pallida]